MTRAFVPANMPVSLDTITPVPETRTGAAGARKLASPGDHTHPRVSSVTTVTLDANGEATVAFTTAFDLPPGTYFEYAEAADGQPVTVKRKSWVMTGAQYSGCIIKGYRMQVMPTYTQLSLATLLTGLVTAVNSLLASLSGFNSAGGSAAGVSVDVCALKKS